MKQRLATSIVNTSIIARPTSSVRAVKNDVIMLDGADEDGNNDVNDSYNFNTASTIRSGATTTCATYGAAALHVNSDATSLMSHDFNSLEYAYHLSEDSRIPVNPQYPTGNANFNLRALWMMYYQHCAKAAHTASVDAVGGQPSSCQTLVSKPGTVTKLKNTTAVATFLSPPPNKLARYASDSSVDSKISVASTAVSTTTNMAGKGSMIVGNDESRRVLQQWLEIWAGKRRTPKKKKAKSGPCVRWCSLFLLSFKCAVWCAYVCIFRLLCDG